MNNDGVKTVLGLRQGGEQNTVVVSALLGDLAQRGAIFLSRGFTFSTARGRWSRRSVNTLARRRYPTLPTAATSFI